MGIHPISQQNGRRDLIIHLDITLFTSISPIYFKTKWLPTQHNTTQQNTSQHNPTEHNTTSQPHLSNKARTHIHVPIPTTTNKNLPTTHENPSPMSPQLNIHKAQLTHKSCDSLC
jgi:hypothetical protein